MLSFAQQINGNHFVILGLFVLATLCVTAYANAKSTLLTKLKKVTVAYTSILAITFLLHGQMFFGINTIALDNPISNTVQEQTTAATNTVVLKVLEFVKKLF
jgi:hypothetical protein